jgi:hypothetical protein
MTSLPDASEPSPLSLAEWKGLFTRAAALVMQRGPPDGVAIFYQTDIKKAGAWVDKGYLVSQAAEEVGCELLWHRVMCRRPPGTVTFGRPAYSHGLCFSRGVRVRATYGLRCRACPSWASLRRRLRSRSPTRSNKSSKRSPFTRGRPSGPPLPVLRTKEGRAQHLVTHPLMEKYAKPG